MSEDDATSPAINVFVSSVSANAEVRKYNAYICCLRHGVFLLNGIALLTIVFLAMFGMLSLPILFMVYSTLFTRAVVCQSWILFLSESFSRGDLAYAISYLCTGYCIVLCTLCTIFSNNNNNDVIARAFTSAGVPAMKEPTGLSRSDGRRPDASTMANRKTPVVGCDSRRNTRRLIH